MHTVYKLLLIFSYHHDKPLRLCLKYYCVWIRFEVSSPADSLRFYHKLAAMQGMRTLESKSNHIVKLKKVIRRSYSCGKKIGGFNEVM